jgi:hypothetical protein
MPKFEQVTKTHTAAIYLKYRAEPIRINLLTESYQKLVENLSKPSGTGASYKYADDEGTTHAIVLVLADIQAVIEETTQNSARV